ncbi:Hypothetical_protein [Hexamita inflata]|uniref:Hypothetical_protein n=1 Tax=Hexamita inflata TaxID=28002 RepID=A0AA86Q1U4_9EUKA|nr:Hypothetical protein HINF_LOCUS32755 [Hexamita inflata]
MTYRNQAKLVMSLNEINDNLAQQNGQLSAELEQLKNQNAELISENNEIHLKLEEYEQEINETGEILEQAAQQSHQLQNKVSSLETENMQLKNELNRKQQAKSTTERALEQTVIKLNQNTQIYKETEQNFDVSVLQKQLMNLNEEVASQKNLIADFEHSHSLLQQKIKEIEIEKFDLQAALDLTKHGQQATQDNYVQAQREIQKLNGELQDLHLRMNFSQISDSNSMIIQNKKNPYEKQFMEMQLTQLQQNITKLEVTISEKESLIQDLKKQILISQTDASQFEKQVKDLCAQQQMNEKHHQQELMIMQKQISTLEQIQVKFQNQQQPQLNDLISQYKNFVMEIHDKVDKQKEVQIVDRPKSKAEKHDSDSEEQQIKNLKSKYNPSKLQNQFTESQIEIYQKEIQNLKDINIQYIEQVKELMNKVYVLQKEISELKAEQNNVQIEQERIKGIKQDYEQKTKQLNDQENNLKEEKIKYKQQLKTMKEHYELTIRNYQHLLQKQVNSKNYDVTAAQKRILEQKMTTEIDELMTKIHGVKQVNVDTDIQVKIDKYQDILNKQRAK